MVVANKTRGPAPKAKAERSEAQRQQARINGAKSRGPRTDAGKAVSCQNAVRHGHRAEKVVSAVDLPRYEDLRNNLLADLPREARTADALLAGNIASAVIRVEKIGASRLSAVALEKRNIRKKHDRPLEQKASFVLRALGEGKTFEAHEFLRQTPKGCAEIAEIWSEIRESLAMLAPGRPIPGELWNEILNQVVTLEPLYQSAMTHQYEEAARTGFITTAMMIEHCDSYIRVFQERAARLKKDHRRALKHKLTIAEADLGQEGQLRERYLGMAASAISRNIQQMDMETHRQWRRDKDEGSAPDPSPARSASEGISPSQTGAWKRQSPQNTAGVGQGNIPSLALRAGVATETEQAERENAASEQATGYPEAEAITRPEDSAPNEPEPSPQILVNQPVEDSITPAPAGSPASVPDDPSIPEYDFDAMDEAEIIAVAVERYFLLGEVPLQLNENARRAWKDTVLEMVKPEGLDRTDAEGAAPAPNEPDSATESVRDSGVTTQQPDSSRTNPAPGSRPPGASADRAWEAASALANSAPNEPDRSPKPLIHPNLAPDRPAKRSRRRH